MKLVGDARGQRGSEGKEEGLVIQSGQGVAQRPE